MLTSNHWVEEGMVTGAVGSMNTIYYNSSDGPPGLLVAIMVHCDGYSGP